MYTEKKVACNQKKKNSPRSFTAGVLINAAEEHACRSSRGMENSRYFFLLYLEARRDPMYMYLHLVLW